MISGYLNVRVAGTKLAGWNGCRESLVEAAEFLWRAGYHAPTWPVHLQARWEWLRYRLFTQGTIRRTITVLDEAEARDLAHALLCFAETALGKREAWCDQVASPDAGFAPRHHQKGN
jgi:hypothetical protein